MRKDLIISLTVIILIVAVVLACIFYTNSLTKKQGESKADIVVAKLTNFEDFGFVQSAGMYEGRLTLIDVNNNTQYIIGPCTQDKLDWVVNDSCYRFNITEVNNNIESHRMSMELSGCYVGTLARVSC